MSDTIEVRVRYAETDNMGYVYYAKYKYKQPAGYDDLLTIETGILSIGRASMKFHYFVRNGDGEILVEGTTKHAFINKDGKIVPFPEEIRQKLLTS